MLFVWKINGSVACGCAGRGRVYCKGSRVCRKLGHVIDLFIRVLSRDFCFGCLTTLKMSYMLDWTILSSQGPWRPCRDFYRAIYQGQETPQVTFVSRDPIDYQPMSDSRGLTTYQIMSTHSDNVT